MPRSSRERGAWTRARELALQTPATRNRYVDLLRALSIVAVVTGHWLIAAPWVDRGELRLDHMLALAPWTRWLTWGLQVMPIFFMVGGYSNAASWDAALRDGQAYGRWLNGRLRRLIGPLVPLIVFWSAIGIIAHYAGVRPAMVRVASQAALVPVWFLAVYVLAVALVPVTRGAWHRYGMASFWTLAAAAILVDVTAFAGGWTPIRWTNYAFVWLAVHQIGYLWRDGRFPSTAHTLAWAAGGLALLIGLVEIAGYPLSMVGVPDEAVSNTLPPTLAMLALGCFQGGLLLSLQPVARRWLDRPVAWAATILVNSTIMTVYLWHLTAMILVIGLSNLLGRVGLELVPGSAAWWASRPAWGAILVVALLPFLAIFGRFERSPAAARQGFPAWRGVIGGVFVCTGLALLALDGVGAEGPPGVRIFVILATLAGAALAGALPRTRARRRADS